MTIRMPEVRRHINRRVSELDIEAETWRAQWKDLKDFVLPWHGFALNNDQGESENEGGEKNRKIIDDTATGSVAIISAGMQSGLTSPARPWFRLATQNIAVMGVRSVQQWLNEVERILLRIFAGSNVYDCFHHTYREASCFGTGAMIVDEDFDTVIRCRPFTVGEYMLALSEKHTVDTFFRRIRLTARQMEQRFEKRNLSQNVLNALERSHPDQDFLVEQLIEPNDDRVKVPQAQGRPFRSMYYEASGTNTRGSGTSGGDSSGIGDTLLSVRGYNEFPVMAPRWNTVGNRTYGDGPGRRALGDIKMIQKLHEKGLISIDKNIDPPLIAPGELKSTVINTMPNGITHSDVSGQSANGLRPLYQVRPSIQEVELKINQAQTRIGNAFFASLFLSLSDSNVQMTAREVIERRDEKLLLLGPVIARMQSDLLNPIIGRTFAIANRMGLIPAAPTDLQGEDLKVDYISPLAQAQKMISTLAIEEWVGQIGAMAGINPDVLDVPNWDLIVEELAELKGVPPKLLNDPRMVQQLRAARAQAAQAAQSLELMQGGAKAAKDFSGVDISEGSAINTLLGQAGRTGPAGAA